MKTETRLKIGSVVVLVLLALLTFLVVKRQYLTAEDAEDAAVRTVVKLEDTVVRDDVAAVAVLALVALFAFVVWTVLRPKGEEDKARPARESSASGTTPIR